MKLTKKKIEKLADDIVKFLENYRMIYGTCIYYNGKRINDGQLEDGEFDPHDYFDSAAYNHILSMSFEGTLYSALNYGGSIAEKFNKIFKKYGLYYEQGDAWNLTVYPSDEMEVEYTIYTELQPRIYIRNINDDKIPTELKMIALSWRLFQEKIGDVGSCVLGAGFEFDYKRQPYFLTPCSRFQGSISWETNMSDIRMMLEEIGAKEISYHWGVMDQLRTNRLPLLECKLYRV